MIEKRWKVFLEKKWDYLIISSFLILHLVYINSPFVNFEWVYQEGSLFFLTGETKHLEPYFRIQANPLTYSYLASHFSDLLNSNHFFVYRLPALLGGVFLLIWCSRSNNSWLLLIIALNPLIWIYSGRAYSELLSVGIMVWAFHWQSKPLLGGLLLAFSSVVKYHSLPFVLLNVGIKWLKDNFKVQFSYWQRKPLIYGMIGILFFVIFLVLYRIKFGFWIAPDYFIERHGTINIQNILNNLFSYGFYLSGMFFLTIPAFLNTEKLKLKAILLVPSILLGIANQNLGEMDFGSFQQLLGNEIILLIKIIGFWNFLLCCQAFWKDEESRTLLLTILGYLFIISLTRPANRYLIFVVPFWAILVCQHISLSRMFWLGYVSVLAGLNLFATLYQISNATASANMADWAIQNDVHINLGGILYSHVGDFSHYDPNSPLVVSLAGAQVGKILHEEPVRVLGFPIRSYVLTDTNPN